MASVTQTATITVNPTPYFYLGNDGLLHAMSLPLYTTASGPVNYVLILGQTGLA